MDLLVGGHEVKIVTMAVFPSRSGNEGFSSDILVVTMGGRC
jgi:hypothetical protein